MAYDEHLATAERRIAELTAALTTERAQREAAERAGAYQALELRKAGEERLRLTAALADGWCDVCSGTGKLLTDAQCALCRGTGKAALAMIGLREALYAAESALADATAAVDDGHAALDLAGIPPALGARCEDGQCQTKLGHRIREATRRLADATRERDEQRLQAEGANRRIHVLEVERDSLDRALRTRTLERDEAIREACSAVGFYTDKAQVTLLGIGMQLREVYRDAKAAPETMRRRDTLNRLHDVLFLLREYHSGTEHAQRCPWDAEVGATEREPFKPGIPVDERAILARYGRYTPPPPTHGYGCPQDGDALTEPCPLCCEHGWVAEAQGAHCPICAALTPPSQETARDEEPS